MKEIYSKTLHIRTWIFNNIIIPWAQMGYWLRGYEGERNNYCFSKIQLAGQKYWDKTT